MKIFVYNSSALSCFCLHKYQAILKHNLRVKTPNIFSERDRTNDNVVRDCNYGALNFKPENTLTKVMDNSNKSFWTTLATSLRNGGGRTLAKQRSWSTICSEIAIRLGYFVFTSDQSNFWILVEGNSKTSVNELQQRVIISLRLTDEGATTPKLVLS